MRIFVVFEKPDAKEDDEIQGYAKELPSTTPVAIGMLIGYLRLSKKLNRDVSIEVEDIAYDIENDFVILSGRLMEADTLSELIKNEDNWMTDGEFLKLLGE